MDKRGIGGHIDWIIGIGLFLVFLGFILTLFKPGVKDVFEPDTLLDIAEENFMNLTSWEIVKQPVFLEKITFKEPGQEGTTELGTDVYVTLEGKWTGRNVEGNFPMDLSSTSKTNIFYIPKANADENREHEIQRGRRNIDDDDDDDNDNRNRLKRKVKENLREHSIPFLIDGSNPKFYVDFDHVEEPKFLIIKSDKTINADPINFHEAAPDIIPAREGADADRTGCEINIYNDEIDGQNNDNACHIGYKLGASETLKGLNLNEIGSLDNYNLLKSQWGFPDTKEFKIRIYDSEDTEISIQTVNDVEPPLEANVYARTFNTQILNSDGILVPVTVNILIW